MMLYLNPKYLIIMMPNKQNLRDGTLDLALFFCYKQINSLKNHLPIAHGGSLLYSFFEATFAAVFVLTCQLRVFPFYPVTNRSELRCKSKELLLLYCKISPQSFIAVLFSRDHISFLNAIILRLFIILRT